MGRSDWLAPARFGRMRGIYRDDVCLRWMQCEGTRAAKFGGWVKSEARSAAVVRRARRVVDCVRQMSRRQERRWAGRGDPRKQNS